MRTRSGRKWGEGSRQAEVSEDGDYNAEYDLVDAVHCDEGRNTERTEISDDEDYNPECDLVDADSDEEDMNQYIRCPHEDSDGDDGDSDARLTRLIHGGSDHNDANDRMKENNPEVNGINSQKKATGPERRQRKRKRRKEEKVLLDWEVHQSKLEDSLSGITDDNEYDPCLQNLGIRETLETPSELTMPLLRFQKEWLAWAVKQEESEFRGGILADEMGMGKTVQAISLVLHSRSKLSGPNSRLSTTKCTLVVCPLVAATQWINEIVRFTGPGTTKVLLYHGPARTANGNNFMNYDFVVTTYSIVESEYRKNVMPPKEKCRWCGKLLHPHKMDYHLKRFCGPNAQKTEKQSKQEKKRTLHKIELVCNSPKSKTLAEDDHVVGKGQRSKMKALHIAKRTGRVKAARGGPSNAVKDEFPSDRGDRHGGKSALHSIKWERIILDEAHYIKARYCNTARAVFALESSYKWALSGTPLQNRIGELYSLIRYLQVYPYSYYFCKECDCGLLDYRFNSSGDKCQVCNHTGARHFSWWNKYVAKPIRENGYGDDGKKALNLLKHVILKSLVLRRTKKGRASDLVLPPSTVTLRQDYMDIKEVDFYEALYTQSQSQFSTYVAKGTLMNNYAHIFELLTRLRQAVNHPYLIVYSSTHQNEKATAQAFCGLCGLVSDDPVVTSCHHTFCRECLINFCKDKDQCVCPDQSCTKLLTLDLNKGVQDITKFYKHTSILSRICLEDFQTSTKIDALKEEVRLMVEKDRAAKAIVFSQFTSFLELIKHALGKAAVRCVLLVGSMSMKARDDAIKTFTDDPDCRVFLMSLKAGGVALNLTVASNVFLMDPWWNPAVEKQAQDRIHRMGQFKPIRVVRFVIANTVEERVLKLQEKKQLVFDGTVGGSSDAFAKLTEQDLHFLFQS